MEILGKFWEKLWPALVVVGFWGGIFLIPIVIDGSSSNTESSPSQSYSSQVNDSSESDSSYVDAKGIDDCTSDCSGHQAGYEWGEENDICDTDYDNGNSESFNQGVRAWAEENCGNSYDTSDSYYDY